MKFKKVYKSNTEEEYVYCGNIANYVIDQVCTFMNVDRLFVHRRYGNSTQSKCMISFILKGYGMPFHLIGMVAHPLDNRYYDRTTVMNHIDVYNNFLASDHKWKENDLFCNAIIAEIKDKFPPFDKSKAYKASKSIMTEILDITKENNKLLKKLLNIENKKY